MLTKWFRQGSHFLNICIAIFLFTLLPMVAHATEQTVRVGWYLVPGLHDYDAIHDKYSGYDYDYLKAISQYTGWKYEFVVEPFAQCMEDLRAGRIDLVGSVSKNPQREQEFLFTQHNVGHASAKLVTLATNTHYAFEDFGKFNRIRIGVVKGSYSERVLPSFARDRNFTYEPVLFTSPAELDIAVQSEQVECALISGLRTVNNSRILAQLPEEVVYFACTTQKPLLRYEFDAALSKIRYFDKGFDIRIYDKYFSNNYIPAVAFNTEEQLYLHRLMQNRETINVAFDPSWMPLEGKDPSTGEYIGIGRDLYTLLAKRTGLRFSFYSSHDFADTVQKYGKKTDLFSIIACDYDWADRLDIALTRPILESQIFKIYTDKEEAYTVAVPEGYYITKALQKRLAQEEMPPIFQFYPDTVSCLEAVRNRKADCTYINSFELNYFMDKIQLEHLNIQSVEGFTISFCIGVSKKAGPAMLGLISRGLASISPTEIDQLVTAQTQHRLQPTITDRIYAKPLLYLGGALAILLTFGFLAFLYLSNRYNKQQRMLLLSANEAKNEFLSRVSHDIRTPINAIIGMTNFAKEDIDDKAKVKDELNKIQTSSHYLLSLINDVLDISKAESNKIELHPEPYPFDEYIQGLETIFRPLCEEKGINFIIDTNQFSSDNSVIVDRIRFDQVSFNLLSNAVKYTPSGGTITYTSISKTLPDHKLSCGFKITDTGIGMSKSFQEKMFTPFSQETDNPDRDKAGPAGSGLGLSIVKKIVDLMGGTITVQSELGKGTEITVNYILPRITKEQLAQIHQQKQGTMANQAGGHLSGKILLAEDNPINTEIALRLLKKFGLEVDVAVNGQMVFEKFMAAPPLTYKAVLLDIQMPILNGYEAAAKIRSSPHSDAKTIPIIALTADAFADAVQKAKAAGMNDHVAKPINKQILYITLAKYIK